MPFFDTISAEKIRWTLISVELICFGCYVLIYINKSSTFEVYLPLLMVVNALTLLPFPFIFNQLKSKFPDDVLPNDPLYSDSEDLENQSEIGLWEKSCIGFFVVTNLGIVILLLFFYIF